MFLFFFNSECDFIWLIINKLEFILKIVYKKFGSSNIYMYVCVLENEKQNEY